MDNSKARAAAADGECNGVSGLLEDIIRALLKQLQVLLLQPQRHCQPPVAGNLWNPTGDMAPALPLVLLLQEFQSHLKGHLRGLST